MVLRIVDNAANRTKDGGGTLRYEDQHDGSEQASESGPVSFNKRAKNGKHLITTPFLSHCGSSMRRLPVVPLNVEQPRDERRMSSSRCDESVTSLWLTRPGPANLTHSCERLRKHADTCRSE